MVKKETKCESSFEINVIKWNGLKGFRIKILSFIFFFLHNFSSSLRSGHRYCYLIVLQAFSVNPFQQAIILNTHTSAITLKTFFVSFHRFYFPLLCIEHSLCSNRISVFNRWLTSYLQTTEIIYHLNRYFTLFVFFCFFCQFSLLFYFPLK